MEFNYFDIVVSAIILLLGLKGIINGFFKEIFGLIGIIGGIFIASRVDNEVGLYLSNLIFKFDNSAAINFTGFLSTLTVFWLGMILIGAIFKKLSSLSGLGMLDKILGFVFGASKFFLIAAVIAHAAYNIKAVKSTIDSTLSGSTLFPILVSTGAFIMKIDPVQGSGDLNATIDKTTKTIAKHIQKGINENMQSKIQEIKKEIKESN
jgi:membrane protein required for colicin V production